MKFVKGFCLMVVMLCVCFAVAGCGTTNNGADHASKVAISKVSVSNVTSLTTDESLFPTTITTTKNFVVLSVKMDNTTGFPIYTDTSRIKLNSTYTISDKVTVGFYSFPVGGMDVLGWNTTIASGTDKTMLFIFETPSAMTTGTLTIGFQVQTDKGGVDISKELSF